MLELIHSCRGFRTLNLLILVVALGGLTSCATKQEPQLVSSGAAPESSLPWNAQQKWESTGQFGPMAEHMERR